MILFIFMFKFLMFYKCLPKVQNQVHVRYMSHQKNLQQIICNKNISPKS